MNTRLADRYHSPDITTDQLVGQINANLPGRASRPITFKRALTPQMYVKNPRSEVNVDNVTKRMRLAGPTLGNLPALGSSTALEDLRK